MPNPLRSVSAPPALSVAPLVAPPDSITKPEPAESLVVLLSTKIVRVASEAKEKVAEGVAVNRPTLLFVPSSTIVIF